MKKVVTEQVEELGYEIQACMGIGISRNVEVMIRDTRTGSLLLIAVIYPDNSSEWATVSPIKFYNIEHAQSHAIVYKQAMLLANRLRPDDEEIEMEATAYAAAMKDIVIAAPLRTAVFTQNFADKYRELCETDYTFCSKCKKTKEESKQKYCGDGNDKDNEHWWEIDYSKLCASQQVTPEDEEEMAQQQLFYANELADNAEAHYGHC